MSNSFSIINCGYGHVISDNDKLTFLGESAEGYIDILLSIVTSMSEDMSKLTGIPVDNIIKDYMEENETNPMTAAFNAVLRRKGCKIEQTPTRCVVDRLIRSQNSKTT